ncbi:MAG: isoprenylcysteine carboxylmethyltransferase family protein [Anaerolineales bacterium]|nr:isoprenylcysteine carboxylmethyltransferase family protein [Anaerolineales bacterium]
MKRDQAIEIATYVIVPLAMLVVSPLLARWLDSFFFSPGPLVTGSPGLLVFGILVFLLGLGLAIWAIFLFKTAGEGTPHPKLPPKKLVTRGPYAVTRNPMALGGFYILLGQAALYASLALLLIALLFVLILYLNAKYVEEPQLKRRFGKAYREYLRRVPRFFPNPFRRA